MVLRVMMISLFVLTTIQAHAKRKVVYGDDNRMDVYQVTDPLYIDLSTATAAMVSKRALEETDNETYKLRGRTLEQRGICSDENFAEQLTVSSCSGFLIASDVIVTAGHCVRSKWDCSSKRWVFGLAYTEGYTEDLEVKKEDVYSCSEIISRELNRETKVDYAVIRLKREVTDRAPLTFRKSGKVSLGDPLVLIGNPNGLPTKVAEGGWVRGNDEIDYFQTNTDSFGGSSGSAVFNAETGEVEGILVRGEDDYEYDRERGCKTVKKCAMDACRGEDVMRITEIPVLENL